MPKRTNPITPKQSLRVQAANLICNLLDDSIRPNSHYGENEVQEWRSHLGNDYAVFTIRMNGRLLNVQVADVVLH